jgi:hypothetical protein
MRKILNEQKALASILERWNNYSHCFYDMQHLSQGSKSKHLFIEVIVPSKTYIKSCICVGVDTLNSFLQTKAAFCLQYFVVSAGTMLRLAAT